MAEPVTQSQTTIPAPDDVPDKGIAALIAKHRLEIDRVKLLDTAGQEKVFSELGVDPKKLEDHYAPLERKAADLRRQDHEANKKVVAAGWGGFATFLASAYALTRSKLKIENTFVRRFVILLSAPVGGVAGSFAASRVFAGKIRDESKRIDVAAKNIFERELAVALENREREGRPVPDVLVHAQAVEQAAQQSAELAAEQAATLGVSKRDTSFAAQAAAEKAAPSPAQQARA